MNEQILFLNMFAQYEPSEALATALSQAAVTAADIDPESKRVYVQLHSANYIPQHLLDQAASQIRSVYGLQHLELCATHPADQLTRIEPEELMAMFVSENSMTRGSLAGARWEWDGNTLNVHLRANGKSTLQECVPAVCRALKDRFDTDVSVAFHAGESLEGQALFEAMEKMRVSMLGDIPRTSGSVAAPAAQEKTPQEQDADVIYGKKFKGISVPMHQLSLDMGFVIVEGRVFNVENKELPKRNAWVINIDITDHTSSVRISRFMENKEAKPILDAISVGNVIKVQGKLLVDNYTNEMVLRPNAIMVGQMEKRKDRAAGEKRVELHLHTTMSNMDALTSTKAAIKQAAAWGHRAIAITDHGCVQSFTDALHVVEAWGGAPKVAGTDDDIKILYGCEGYYINDVDDKVAIKGKKDITFDQPFVAFDLETTGLDPKNDKIIDLIEMLCYND